MTDRQRRPEGRDGFASVPDWYTREAVPALGLTPRETAIYVVLRGRANADGVCWPSLDRIAYESGQSVRAVRTGMRALVAAGLVDTLGRPSRIEEQRYRVGMKPTIPAPPPLVSESSKRADREARGASDGGGQPIAASVAAMGREPVDNSPGADVRAADIAAPERQILHRRAADSADEVDPGSRPIEVHPGNAHRGCAIAPMNRPTGKQLAHLADLRAAMHNLEDDGDCTEPPATAADADDLIRAYRSEQHRRIHNGEPFDCALADLSTDGRRYFADRDLTDLFDHTAAVPA